MVGALIPALKRQAAGKCPKLVLNIFPINASWQMVAPSAPFSTALTAYATKSRESTALPCEIASPFYCSAFLTARIASHQREMYCTSLSISKSTLRWWRLYVRAWVLLKDKSGRYDYLPKAHLAAINYPLFRYWLALMTAYGCLSEQPFWRAVKSWG